MLCCEPPFYGHVRWMFEIQFCYKIHASKLAVNVFLILTGLVDTETDTQSKNTGLDSEINFAPNESFCDLK